jgi:hypothetical protein
MIEEKKNEIDIELLLETIEKIENRDNEVLPLFYEKSTFNLSECSGFGLISGKKRLLSEEIKRFIKLTFTEKEIRIEYLKPLISFIKDQKPLSIFSTNYDVCIEELCRVTEKNILMDLTQNGILKQHLVILLLMCSSTNCMAQLHGIGHKRATMKVATYW